MDPPTPGCRGWFQHRPSILRNAKGRAVALVQVLPSAVLAPYPGAPTDRRRAAPGSLHLAVQPQAMGDKTGFSVVSYDCPPYRLTSAWNRGSRRMGSQRGSSRSIGPLTNCEGPARSRSISARAASVDPACARISAADVR
jgi:hypothetical protein